MNVIRCKNGHFFDGDVYDKCPHCGEGVMVAGGASPKEEKKGFWNRGKKGKVSEDARSKEVLSATTLSDFSNGDTPTDMIRKDATSGSPTPPPKKTLTLSFGQTSSTSESEFFVPNSGQEEMPSPLFGGTVTEEKTQEENRPVTPAHSLKDAVRNASASSEGKTMSYFSVANASAEGQNKPRQSTEPVVGWLVGIGGCHVGQCFNIYAGKNSIGRSEENRIVVADDNSISRSKHAFIVYEPKKRNFYLQPGDSSGLTYLNDEYITESHKLSSRDMIELGESKFMFVPLCGEDFSWEEYVQKGE